MFAAGPRKAQSLDSKAQAGPFSHSHGGVPKELLEIMQKYGTLVQGKWTASDVFEYRYELNPQEGLFACFARLRGNLFVTGFAADNCSVVASEIDVGWIKPCELLGRVDSPACGKKP